jgi:ADP-ribose pyrophosphatase YjhB (NUDIX family)
METTQALKVATVVFPLRKTADGTEEVLLGEKTKKIGIGCPTGPGGMVNENETIRQAAARETFEETGLIVAPNSLRYVGVITFNNYKTTDTEPFRIRVHFFLAPEWSGTVIERDDGFKNLIWYEVNDLPLSRMMAADPHFVPRMLAGEKVIGSAHYLGDQRTLYPNTNVFARSVIGEFDVE